VAREIEHYNLDAILAVGFRVRSHRGTQFRQWALGRLNEYLVKGFTMDDERLKNPPGKGQKDYFDELLERIRDIRASERRFYQKVLDIYATSVDYAPDTEMSQHFFATVQDKMHWAVHGQTAAEVIHARADAGKPFMGLHTTRPGGMIRKEDVAIAKNYLSEDELQVLNRIVNLYLEYAELQALERRPMTMRDWIAKLDEFPVRPDWNDSSELLGYADLNGAFIPGKEACIPAYSFTLRPAFSPCGALALVCPDGNAPGDRAWLPGWGTSSPPPRGPRAPRSQAHPARLRRAG
jgi:hypothetical protein